jgi:hypothetical protein
VAIIHDKINVGNFQPLPKSFNSSKGSKSDGSTPWATYKGRELDSTYHQNLIYTQKDIRKDIQRQINEFRKQNSGNN